jgi:hypothetical protein
MPGGVQLLGGQRVYVLAHEGPLLVSERAAADVIGDIFGTSVSTVAIPLSRVPPGFLTLSTRIAGEVIQKFVTYHFRVAILGDVSAVVARSDALRDFVRESNRGRHVWFVDDLAALEARLAAAA